MCILFCNITCMARCLVFVVTIVAIVPTKADAPQKNAKKTINMKLFSKRNVFIMNVIVAFC